MLVVLSQSIENRICVGEVINCINLQLISSFDVFKVGDSHLRLVGLVGKLLHLLLDCVHPEADQYAGYHHFYTDPANLRLVFVSYFSIIFAIWTASILAIGSIFLKTNRLLQEVTEVSECSQGYPLT